MLLAFRCRVVGCCESFIVETQKCEFYIVVSIQFGILSKLCNVHRRFKHLVITADSVCTIGQFIEDCQLSVLSRKFARSIVGKFEEPKTWNQRHRNEQRHRSKDVHELEARLKPLAPLLVCNRQPLLFQQENGAENCEQQNSRRESK